MPSAYPDSVIWTAAKPCCSAVYAAFVEDAMTEREMAANIKQWRKDGAVIRRNEPHVQVTIGPRCQCVPVVVHAELPLFAGRE